MPQSLHYYTEPSLVFGHGQVLQSAKDGLFLFGPVTRDVGISAIRYGLIGTPDGIALFKKWINDVQEVIEAPVEGSVQYRTFPGFANVFGVELPSSPICVLNVDAEGIRTALRIPDRHLAVHATVDLFLKPMQRFLTEEESFVSMWFVVIPEDVYALGRPQSTVPVSEQTESTALVDAKMAKSIATTPSLFPEDNDAAEPYYYEKHFHNQLKARLLEGPVRAVVQVVRETSIAPYSFLRRDGKPIRRVQDPATVAWNLCTTAFFKSCGRPWQLARVRNRVCYVGLVFKKLPASFSNKLACCGAQMFLDSGDGLVFKGAVGKWHSKESGEFHLDEASAKDLLTHVVRAYVAAHNEPPAELFIHAPSAFNDAEWSGFRDAVSSDTKLVGVRIRSTNSLKLFRAAQNPVLRGTAYLQSQRTGFLWTRGYVPYLKTYPGRENPNPLRIDVLRGAADISTVLEDVMNLTKLNYNACIYGDGFPVTLRFARAVGEILTAGPTQRDQPPLPFKHYI